MRPGAPLHTAGGGTRPAPAARGGTPLSPSAKRWPRNLRYTIRPPAPRRSSRVTRCFRASQVASGPGPGTARQRRTTPFSQSILVDSIIQKRIKQTPGGASTRVERAEPGAPRFWVRQVCVRPRECIRVALRGCRAPLKKRAVNQADHGPDPHGAPRHAKHTTLTPSLLVRSTI